MTAPPLNDREQVWASRVLRGDHYKGLARVTVGVARWRNLTAQWSCAKHRSKWWLLQMSEKFSDGTENLPKRTKWTHWFFFRLIKTSFNIYTIMQNLTNRYWMIHLSIIKLSSDIFLLSNNVKYTIPCCKIKWILRERDDHVDHKQLQSCETASYISLF